jgi:ParB family chromosome partitioning protein
MAIQRLKKKGGGGPKKELATEDQWEEWIHRDGVDGGCYLADIPLDEIRMLEQVRQDYPEESIGELADSIRSQGLLQPIQLKREGAVYRIVYGHRRFLAVKRLGWPTIKALVDYAADEEILARQIVENIQREDLSPIDEALGLKQLMEIKGFKQIELAGYVGKSKYYVTETLSILRLLEKVGHAQLFERIKDKTILVKISRISDENLLQKALDVVKKGGSREEILHLIAGHGDQKGKNSAETRRTRRARDLETYANKVMKILHNFRDETLKIVMKYESELEDEEWKGLGRRFESKLDELKEIMQSLFKVRQKAESQHSAPPCGSGTELVFPGTAALASISYKLVSISYSFISYSSSSSYSSSCSRENNKSEIIQFILEKLPNLEKDVLEEASVEEIVDYWNSLPFKKIEKSVEGFFYQSLSRRYSLPERYLELKAQAQKTPPDPDVEYARQKGYTFEP